MKASLINYLALLDPGLRRDDAQEDIQKLLQLVCLAVPAGLRVLALLLGLAGGAHAAAGAPDLRLQPLEGEVERLSDYSGQVVLLHFWATWCIPCREEIPALVAFHQGPYQRLHQRGLVLLTVSNDVRRRDIESFIEEFDLPFPVYYDSLMQLNRKLRFQAVPATAVFDRDGALRDIWLGEQDWDSPTLLGRLENYLDGP